MSGWNVSSENILDLKLLIPYNQLGDTGKEAWSNEKLQADIRKKYYFLICFIYFFYIPFISEILFSKKIYVCNLIVFWLTNNRVVVVAVKNNYF